MYKIIYTKRAVRDVGNLKALGLDKKVKELIEIMRENPFQILPDYEKLVGNLKGYYSRRISIQRRMVYQICMQPGISDGVTSEGIVKIIRM